MTSARLSNNAIGTGKNKDYWVNIYVELLFLNAW